MERRLSLIRALYEGQCSQGPGHSSWLNWTHKVAQKIAAGQEIVDGCIGCDPAHTAGVVSQLRSWGIPVAVTNPTVLSAGLAITRDQIASEVQRLVSAELEKQRRDRGAIVDAAQLPADALVMAETATLHEAIEAFKKHRQAIDGGNTTTWTKKTLKQLSYIEEAHEDCPLWQLDLPKIQTMVAYWRNRPHTRKGKRCSWDHAHDILKEMFRFLRWLDETPNFKWAMPKGACPFVVVARKAFVAQVLACLVSEIDYGQFMRAIHFDFGDDPNFLLWVAGGGLQVLRVNPE